MGERGIKMKKCGKWVLLALTLLWCAVIWQFSLSPASESSATSGEVLVFCNDVLEKAGTSFRLTSHTVRKLAHFTEFFVLGVLSFAAALAHGLRLPYLLSASLVLLVATVDETVQRFVPGRGPAVRDVLLDLTGGIAGAAFLWLLYILVKETYKKRKKTQKSS